MEASSKRCWRIDSESHRKITRSKKNVLPHFQIYQPIHIRPVQRREQSCSRGEELRGNSQDETEASLTLRVDSLTVGLSAYGLTEWQ